MPSLCSSCFKWLRPNDSKALELSKFCKSMGKKTVGSGVAGVGTTTCSATAGVVGTTVSSAACSCWGGVSTTDLEELAKGMLSSFGVLGDSVSSDVSMDSVCRSSDTWLLDSGALDSSSILQLVFGEDFLSSSDESDSSSDTPILFNKDPLIRYSIEKMRRNKHTKMLFFSLLAHHQKPYVFSMVVQQLLNWKPVFLKVKDDENQSKDN